MNSKDRQTPGRFLPVVLYTPPYYTLQIYPNYQANRLCPAQGGSHAPASPITTALMALPVVPML